MRFADRGFAAVVLGHELRQEVLVGDVSKSHIDDRDAFIQCIEPQLDQGREFVLLAHSYGSIPGVAACENQTVEERAATGKKGGIRLVIMVCCGAVVRKGQTMLGEA
ncbi:hypothetical protein LQW54_012383 [Pestalotiopsis sp. IQ-011]